MSLGDGPVAVCHHTADARPWLKHVQPNSKNISSSRISSWFEYTGMGEGGDEKSSKAEKRLVNLVVVLHI